MMDSPPVSIALEKMGVPHQIFRHSGPVTSLEQAARERGQSPEQIIRSILFRVGDDSFVMVLMAGPSQVAWPKLRSYLGQSRLTTASEEEVLRVTGYKVGAVSPFGLPSPLRILADESIFEPDEISIGSGERNVTIILRSEELRKALKEAEIGNFSGSK